MSQYERAFYTEKRGYVIDIMIEVAPHCFVNQKAAKELGFIGREPKQQEDEAEKA